MTAKVVALQIKPGIQRDGTQFASPTYVDGQWVRFQNGLPKKIGGYNGIFLNATGISRGMYMSSLNGLNYIVSGYNNGLEQWVTDNVSGIGSGPTQLYPVGSITTQSIKYAGIGYVNGTYTGVTPVTSSGNGSGATYTVVVSGNAITTLTNTATGINYGYGDTFSFANSDIGGNALSTVAVTGTAGQFSCASTITLVAGQSISVTGTLTGTATGIQPGTYYVITGGTTTFTLSATAGGTALVTTAGTTTGLTFNPVTPFQGQFTSVTYYGNNVAPSLSYFQPNANNLWQFEIGYDSTGGNQNKLVAHPGQNLSAIDSTVNTRPLFGNFTSTALNPVGVFTATGTTTNGSPNVTFTTTNYAMGPGVSISGTGVPSNTTIVSSNLVSNNFTLANVAVTGTAGQFSCSSTTLISGQQVIVTGVLTGTATGISAGTYYIIATNGSTTFTLSTTSGGSAITTTAGTTAGLTFVAQVASVWTVVMSANATASGTVTLTFDNNISVSGGVVMLHPYLFVYGNNGLIQNCAASDFNNWTSADSNANNVSTGKIVKGLPLRGGTTSPAGLFWSLDSVIRVSYTPSTVGGVNYYWKYDLITSQSSILSSSSVIEYDGLFYWIGVDRFLMYNGVVQEIPNSQNQNWFFDNLNYQQRQKVWCTKVTRWGEIWWFYPRGNATECTDAIIYNVREKTWYDAGQAVGAQRSAGTYTEVFHYPVMGGYAPNSAGKYTLWQHETGTDQVYTNQVDAINSYIETPSLGTYAGLVGSTQQPGDNVWTRCERVEPDFVQSGTMTVTVLGKGYADDTDITSAPYPFDPTTLKVDMREQRRELRLRFTSNVVGGNYFMGKVLCSLDVGDTRSTANPS